MALYAHAVIEVPVDADDPSAGVVLYQRGYEVPDDLPGIEELIDGGSVSEQEYDPEVDKSETPEVIEIDGARYVRASDGANGSENADAR